MNVWVNTMSNGGSNPSPCNVLCRGGGTRYTQHTDNVPTRIDQFRLRLFPKAEYNAAPILSNGVLLTRRVTGSIPVRASIYGPIAQSAEHSPANVMGYLKRRVLELCGDQNPGVGWLGHCCSPLFSLNVSGKTSPKGRKMTEKQKLVRLITSKARLSFNALFRPEDYKGKGDPKYSATLLFDPTEADSVAFLKNLKAECKRLAVEEFGTKNVDAKMPFKKGDERTYDGYAGMIYITPRSKFPPQIVGPRRQPLQEGDVYPGCYVRASVSAYAWKVAEDNFGVSLYLGNLQKISDGDPFGGGAVPAESEFDDIGEVDEDTGFEDDDLSDDGMPF